MGEGGGGDLCEGVCAPAVIEETEVSGGSEQKSTERATGSCSMFHSTLHDQMLRFFGVMQKCSFVSSLIDCLNVWSLQCKVVFFVFLDGQARLQHGGHPACECIVFHFF